MSTNTRSFALKGMTLEKVITLSIMLFLTPFLLFFYILIPLLILRWMGIDLVAWWRGTFADPVLSLAFRLTLFFDGNAVWVISILALVMMVMVSLLSLIWQIFYRILVGQPSEVRRLFIPGTESSTEDWERLRSQLGDDLESLLLRSSQWKRISLRVSRPRITHLTAKGCIIQLVSPVYYLVSLAVTVAFYDTLMRLYSSMAVPAELFSKASEIGIDLANYTTFPPVWNGINLAERSLPLVLLILCTEILSWLVNNTSVTGWTFPRPTDGWTWLLFGIGLVMCFIFLNGAILISILVVKAGHFLVKILNLLVVENLRLYFATRSLRRSLEKM